MSSNGITLDQAYEVINAHYTAEDAKRAVESRKLVGRYFKFAGEYTGTDKPFWRFVVVTGVDKSGWPVAQQWRIEVDHEVSLARDFVPPMSGWKEIDPDEYTRFIVNLHEEEPE